MEYMKLFEPIKIGNMALKNRIVMSPMGTSLAETPFTPSDRHCAYYGERAKGGAGLIVIEHTFARMDGAKSEKSLGLWDKASIPAWKKLVSEIHKYGTKAAVEIGHAGDAAEYTASLGIENISASPIRSQVLQYKTHGATEDEIKQFQEDYRIAARNAVDAGFDAIVLHFTNGYFIASWLSGRSNRRTDRYGGNLKNRLRFAQQLYSIVREEVGPNFPLIARLSSREEKDGRGLEESIVLAKELEAMGIDALDINAGSLADYDWEFPSYFKQQGFLLEDIERIKQHVNIPVMGGGRITEPMMAEYALRDQRLDLVTIGREFIADPFWAQKAMTGQEESIVHCIGCTRCMAEKEKAGIICSVNPFVGREGDSMAPAEKRKKVLVVGAGPAGLEAAVTAARLGHNVTVAEKDTELGGKLRTAAMAPLKWEMVNVITALSYNAEKLGVKILKGTTVTPEWVKAGGYDEVLVATGSSPIKLRMNCTDDVTVTTAVDVLNGDAWVGDKVAIIGGGLIGCEFADFVSDYGKDVTIFEMKDKVAEDCIFNIRKILLARLAKKNVKIKVGVRVLGCEHGSMKYMKGETEFSDEGCNTIVYAVGLKSDNKLAEALKAEGIDAHVIGDANKVARLHEALVSGMEAAKNI